MKFLVLVTIAAVAMGSLFHEDIARSFSGNDARSRASIPGVQSADNLGKSLNENMQGIGASLGH